jgi:hypothetical protein
LAVVISFVINDNDYSNKVLLELNKGE